MELVGGQSKLQGNLRKFHYCITKFHFHIQNFESPKFYWLQQISYACKFETMWSTCGNVEVLPLWNTPIILGSLLLENFGKCNQLENSFPSRQSTFAAASVEVFYSNAPITPTSRLGQVYALFPRLDLGISWTGWLVAVVVLVPSQVSWGVAWHQVWFNVNVPLLLSSRAASRPSLWAMAMTFQVTIGLVLVEYCPTPSPSSLPWLGSSWSVQVGLAWHRLANHPAFLHWAATSFFPLVAVRSRRPPRPMPPRL